MCCCYHAFWLLIYLSSSASNLSSSVNILLPTPSLFSTYLVLLSSSLLLFFLSSFSLISFKLIPSRVQGVHFWCSLLQLCPPCYCHHGTPHPWNSHGTTHWKSLPLQCSASACRGGAATTSFGGSSCGVLLQRSPVRVLCGHLKHSVCHVCP